MILYLAGGVTGNLNPVWKRMKAPTLESFCEQMKIFLAGGERRHWVYDPLTKEENNAGFWQGSPRGEMRGGTTR